MNSTRAKKVLFGVLYLVLLFFVCDDVFMPWFVNQGGTVKVPAVVGLSFERARLVMDSLRLEAREGDVRPSETYAAGTVIAQNPQPGTAVKRGRRVYVVLSGGEQLVYVPSLRGKTVRDAKFALERNGLKLGSTSYAVNDSFPANTIIDQNLAPQSSVRRGMRVSVSVSQGTAVDRVTVPNVVGRPLTEAGRMLANGGLRVGTINYQISTTLLPNTVLDQFPRPGDLVERGHAVELFVVRSGERRPPTEN